MPPVPKTHRSRTTQPLPTPWNLYNLEASPFFQEPLEVNDDSPRPLSLFVGREKEVAYLLDGIRGAGENSSCQAIAGAPGVGKTTLVKEIKAQLSADGYFTTDALVPILASDTTPALFGRVLSLLYDIIIANRPQSVDNQAMRDAQLLVRAARLPSGGGNISALGTGIGLSRGSTVVTPSDIMIDGPRVMRDLVAFVRGSDSRGVLIHINNLENLSNADVGNAASILRDLRDIMLQQNGMHYVIAGTTDAVNAAVNTHAQVRTIVSMLIVNPMEIADVYRMLQARYEHMRLNDDRPAVAPANDKAVAALYELFGGDLRGLLKALEDGVRPLLGLAGMKKTKSADEPPVRSLTIDELRPVLQNRYSGHLESLPEKVRIEQLTKWGRSNSESTQTQKTLSKLWGLSQGAVSTALAYLIAQGYVLMLPRSNAAPTAYRLSGISRLIFG